MCNRSQPLALLLCMWFETSSILLLNPTKKIAFGRSTLQSEHVMRVICLFLLALSGCTALPADSPATAPCEAQRVFYVVSHGWHTGVVVNRQDLVDLVPGLAQSFGDEKYLEIGWGDARFYQSPTGTFQLALQAILWPTSTVLHVVGLPVMPQAYFRGSEIVEVTVPEAGYERLLMYIARGFTRTADNDVIRLGPGLYGKSGFYRAEGTFHAFNTCNTWVAKAIAESGYPINSTGRVTAEAVMSQLHRDAETDCYFVRPVQSANN